MYYCSHHVQCSFPLLESWCAAAGYTALASVNPLASLRIHIFIFNNVVMFLPNPGHCVCLLTNRRYFVRTVLVFISMFAGLFQTCQNKECIINFRIKALDFLKLHSYNEEVMPRFLTSYILFWRHSLNMPRTETKTVINSLRFSNLRPWMSSKYYMPFCHSSVCLSFQMPCFCCEPSTWISQPKIYPLAISIKGPVQRLLWITQ